MNNRGEVQEAFDKIKASQTMRLAWLEKWQSMDKDGSRLLDYPELLKTCGLEDNMWSSRVFDLLDKNIIGAAATKSIYHTIKLSILVACSYECIPSIQSQLMRKRRAILRRILDSAQPTIAA